LVQQRLEEVVIAAVNDCDLGSRCVAEFDCASQTAETATDDDTAFGVKARLVVIRSHLQLRRCFSDVACPIDASCRETEAAQ
jgi:hypothetical protein